METVLEEFKTLFNNNSYKLTGQRREVLELLVENRSLTMSAEEIYHMLRKRKSKIGLATIYRALSVLDKLKLVEKVYYDGCMRYRYIGSEKEQAYAHFVCEACGCVLNLQPEFLTLLKEKARNEKGFVVTFHKIKLMGLCNNCYHKEIKLQRKENR